MFDWVLNRYASEVKDWGCIQTEYASIQMLWVPKKMSPKMKERKRKLLLSDKFLK